MLLSILMTGVMYLHFRIQEEDILEHTHAKQLVSAIECQVS